MAKTSIIDLLSIYESTVFFPKIYSIL